MDVLNFYITALKYIICGFLIVTPFAYIHYIGNCWGVKKRSDKFDLTEKDSKKAKTYYKENM